MNGSALLSLFAGGLQLIVPSYGLRLVRRFGAQSVGWFLVIAFASMAMLHLIVPSGSDSGASSPFLTAEVIFAVGSVLLLIGMGHLETVFSERGLSESQEKALCRTWESRVRSETTELTLRNRDLADAKMRLEKRLAELQESEARYRFLFEENPQAMWIFDLRTLRILAMNHAALRQHGFSGEEFLDMTAHDLLPDEAIARFQQYVTSPCSGAEGPLRWRLRRKNDSMMDVEMVGLDLKYADHPARLVLISDLGPRRLRDIEARNALRQEIISHLAGGFAHHFNNLLGVVETSAFVLEEHATAPAAVAPLKSISAAVHRGASLTRQLLTVAGQRAIQTAPLDLNSQLRSMAHILRRLVGPKIVIQNIFAADAPAALADSQLTEQIILNLVLNSRDAMPNGGTITITTTMARRKDVSAAPDGELRKGEFVRLAIRDTGCGMSSEVQSRLFEPFFTTKEVGQGTGLGLASVYGAVKQLSGWIEFVSEPRKGTEFRIFLPAAAASALANQIEAAPAKALATVLLVEPDDRARGTARCVLSWNGYRVVEADSCETALMLWEKQAAHVQLLLVDADATGECSGRLLSERLRQTKSNLKVVFTSRHANANSNLVSNRDGLMLSKPYTPELLLRAVQTAIGEEI